MTAQRPHRAALPAGWAFIHGFRTNSIELDWPKHWRQRKSSRMGLYKAAALSIVIALLLGAIMVVATWDADPDEPLTNEVHFRVSCSDWSQRQFNHATSLLHSLRYGYSESSYAAIARYEPDCGMAYWGIAMSRLKRPIAIPPSPEDIRAAETALRTATDAHTVTPRER